MQPQEPNHKEGVEVVVGVVAILLILFWLWCEFYACVVKLGVPD